MPRDEKMPRVIAEGHTLASICRTTGTSRTARKLFAVLPACQGRLRFEDCQWKVRIEAVTRTYSIGKARGDGMATASLQQMTVTVVDDEPAARDVLVRAARSWNFACQGAASAEEAIELLTDS